MGQIGFFYNGWEPVFRIFLVGTLAYFSLVLLLRVSGNRSLAQLNAFDFVITVALGSAFGRVLTARQVALSEAVAAFVLLVCLQYLISRLQRHSRRFSRFISAPPSLLFYQGRYMKQEMRRQRLTESDLCAVALRYGAGSLKEIDAIILEAHGKFGVVKKQQGSDLSLVSGMEKSADSKDDH